MRRLTFLLALLLVAPVLIAEDGKKDENAKADKKKKKEKKAGDIEIPPPGTHIEDAAVARSETGRFSRAMAKAKSDDEKIKLMARLGKWDHPDVVKAASKYLKNKSWRVAVAAVVLVARQTSAKEKAGKALFSCLKKEKRTNVVCALLVGLGVLGYETKLVHKEVKKYFMRDTSETHKAATRYWGYVKYKPAFRLLAEKLEEPKPKRPDDPTNPPASWWRERWYEWDSNVPYTRWAMSQLVPGETFESTAEAKEWAETEGKKHGIEW